MSSEKTSPSPPSPPPNPPPSRGRASGEKRVALAAVAGAHGVKGEVRLKLFTDSTASLSVHAKVYIDGIEHRLLGARDAGKTAIARFDGIADRSAAEALRGQFVEVDRSNLPGLEEGEYYYADLVGLECVDRDGQPVGTVTAVENFGAGDLLEVELTNGRKSLIPFRYGIADLEGERIVLDREFLA